MTKKRRYYHSIDFENNAIKFLYTKVYRLYYKTYFFSKDWVYGSKLITCFKNGYYKITKY